MHGDTDLFATASSYLEFCLHLAAFAIRGGKRHWWKCLSHCDMSDYTRVGLITPFRNSIFEKRASSIHELGGWQSPRR